MSEVDFLLLMLDEAFERKTWHGSNLRGSIRRVDVACAAWKPSPKRKSIWEHVLHAAYWKYTVYRRLVGAERGSFPLKGSNWFDRTEPADAPKWAADVKLLSEMHQQLRSAVADLKPRKLDETPNGSKISNRRIVLGIAYHDIYHAGQIQLLKRLYADQVGT